jgi:hypothetical protein
MPLTVSQTIKGRQWLDSTQNIQLLTQFEQRTGCRLGKVPKEGVPRGIADLGNPGG